MKKHIALLLSVIMVFTSFMQISTQAANVIFIDPADEGYFKNLTNLGVFPLYSDEEFFDGTKEVNRAEAAMAIAGLLNMGHESSSSIGEKFIDVLPTEPASGAIALMSGIGAMNGFGDNLFRPYQTIETIHFVKALMVALGYRWRAEISGGYPIGYMNAAANAGVLENITVEDGKALTRSVLLKILNNAIDVPVYDIVSVSNDQVNLEINEDVTVLTKYHHIYKDTGIVNSNSMTSLNEAVIPQKESILIGNRTVYLGEDKSIRTHLGENVTYYYKQSDSSSKATLVWFEQDDNNIVILTESDIASVSGNTVTYTEPLSGKEKRISYTSSTLVIYNGGRGGINLADKLVDFSGTVSFISNNGDNSADVIILNDYNYDEVYSVDATSEKIYFKNESIDLLSFETYMIENQQGKVMDLSEVVLGDVYAISKSADGSLIRLLNLTSAVSGTVSEKGSDSFVIDGTSYNLSSSCDPDSISMVKINGVYTFYLNSSNTVVYIKEGKANILSIGYLMDYATDANTFDSSLFLKILSASGSAEIYEVKEKVKINGESVERDNVPSKLTELKNNLNLASDGRVSQVIRYSIDGDGFISTIYTALLEENDYLQLKFNSEGVKTFLRDHGYGVGAFNYKHLIGNNTTFFQVPQTEQETLSEDYYLTFRYQDKMEDGESYMVETYIIGDEIYPAAGVYYTTETAGVDPYADLFLVDAVSQSVNSLGDPVAKFTGYMNGVPATYQSTETLDISGVSRGDTLVFDLTSLDEVRNFIKVYDVSENKIHEDYYNEAINVQKSVSMFSVYRVKGAYMEATNKGFTNMDTAFDNMYDLNFSRASSIAFYDSRTDTTGVTDVNSIVDYVHTGDDCTKMLIRYQHGYRMNAIIYK